LRPGSLEVYLLGTVDFDAALFLQERLVYEISGRDDAQGALLLCEHPPLVTVGREGSRAHFRRDPAEFKVLEVDVRWLSRGGGCLVHGPGQLAVCPILPLDRLRLGLAEYRRVLEESAIDMSHELRIVAERRPDQPGVWCRSGQFAFVGAAVKRWVSHQGMFVNVCPSLRLMRLVDPTGRGERITSLAAERAWRTSMHAVRESLIRNLARRLQYEHVHLYSGHPLLIRTKRTAHVYA
jgi:lipoyl(octanoyl) transferase